MSITPAPAPAPLSTSAPGSSAARPIHLDADSDTLVERLDDLADLLDTAVVQYQRLKRDVAALEKERQDEVEERWSMRRAWRRRG